ncbi:matrix metallopeptidase-21 isoform X1 [Brienomyrus brachyistius]|uniref:matrix metallopeptidase-21 isoform X1 n=1 Tax=Brienomyrus brachyistius TaxID=42636 RepID=UPI0020B2D56A|nr:matrix metallopeptidase-21 isoform X1 [Brienomyrus brachyistius]
MLIWTQLTAIFLLTDFFTVHTEKIFHTRDRSDVELHAPHHAELIVDTDTARQFLSKYGFLKSLRLDESQSEEADYSPGGERLHTRIQEGRAASRAGIESDVGVDTPDFISGLRQFQVTSGLPETGVFDDATKAAMNKPRCGVPDRVSPTASSVKDNSSGSAPADPLASNATINVTDNQSDQSPKPASAREKRHLLTLLSKRRPKPEAGNLRQIAFSKQLLKWRLFGEGYSSQLSIDDQRYIFKLAFRMWSEVSPLEFIEDTLSPLAEIDIRLGFGTGRHLGCTQAFDGAGQEFAHAWFLGDIHFDDDEHFTAPNTGYGISLLKVAVHEIGHVLGLPHIFRSGSIMQPSYLPQDTGFEIDWLDRKAIQKLYGGCRGRFSTVFDWIRKERSPYGEVVVRFNTYFMRGGWYWMYENRSNRTRYGDPVAVQVGWHGVPSNGVDAYVHVWTWTTDAAYFFKGTQYWRYDSENDQAFTEDSEGRRYPRLISEGFPGVPSPIDTAFYDRRDFLIYFFKGMDVYTFHVGTHAVASGYPKKIKEAFPALVPGDHPEGHLDAAYFSYTHNAVFLLKGTRFWRVLGTREQRLKPSLPRNSLLPGKEVDQQWFDICDVHKTNLKMVG